MDRQCCIASASINGIEAVLVSVEVSVGSGIPGISIVGMGDTAIHEARERVRAAIKSSGFKMPSEKIVVNLAPGGIKKIGAGFDLPIAIGILAATGQIDSSRLDGKMFVGELSLQGEVRSVSGDMAFCICASRVGIDYVSAPRPRAPLDSIKQYCLSKLSDLAVEDALSQAVHVGPVKGAANRRDDLDFADVSGHECAKRAIQIAVAGRHGLLMVGPPGSGKTMLASRIPSIMPNLSQAESLETAAIHSVAGEDVTDILKGIPPFRNPHHSATLAGLLGGGSPLLPGEVSLAHNGVLFLDELAEFKPTSLQGLRQPIEDGKIAITRATGKTVVPSSFMLAAATNPCPCGYYGDEEHECGCTFTMVKKYMSRIGGPLIDRFDMQLDVHRVPSSSFMTSGSKISSSILKEGILKARSFSSWRGERRAFNGHGGKKTTREGIFELFDLDEQAKRFSVSMAESKKMSGRAIKSMLNIARTVADMEEEEVVGAEHVAEAYAFRMSDIIGGF